jgi:hypothetical protein
MRYSKLPNQYRQRIDIAAVAVDNQKSTEAKNFKRPYNTAKDAPEGLKIEANGSPEREMMLAHS